MVNLYESLIPTNLQGMVKVIAVYALQMQIEGRKMLKIFSALKTHLMILLHNSDCIKDLYVLIGIFWPCLFASP